jgi:AraC-like DNA-binding protein
VVEGHYTAIAALHLRRVARAAGVRIDVLAAARRLPSAPDFEDRIPAARVVDLWEAILRETRDPTLPARASRYGADDESSLLGFFCAAQPDLEAGLATLERYWPTVTDVYRWRVEHRAQTASLFACPADLLDRAGWRAHFEFEVADIVQTITRVTGGRARPLAVEFAHRPATDALALFTELLGVEPTFAAPRMAVVYRRGDLSLPFIGRKPALALALAGRLDDLLARLAADRPIAQNVRDVLPSVLHGGGAIAVRVARRLGLGRRSMERRLALEGTSLRALIDETRADLAREWLRVHGVPEVARRLGYSTVRAFDRAFSRWEGVTPKEWRG